MSLRSEIPQLYRFTMYSPGVTTGRNMREPLTPERDILDLRDLMKSVVLERNRPKRIYISLINLLFMVIQVWLSRS